MNKNRDEERIINFAHKGGFSTIAFVEYLRKNPDQQSKLISILNYFDEYHQAKTGQPRDSEEIDEAINAVEQIMVKHSTVLPLFTVHAGIIHDCLIELRVRRLLDEPISKR